MDRIKKKAKLFQSGEYLDKGVTVTTEDLRRIVDGFRPPLPVKIEHTDTAFDGGLGEVTCVYVQGEGALYGDIEFDPDAWSMIDKMDAKKLSVGLRSDFGALTEVSIVKNPRVADAQVFCFSEDVVFLDSFEDLRANLQKALVDDGGLVDFGTDWVVYREASSNDLKKCSFKVDGTGRVVFGVPYKVKVEYIDDASPDVVVPYAEEDNMEENRENVLFSENENLKKQVSELQNQLEKLKFSARETAVDGRLNELVAAGKITPAGREIAKAIMLAGDGTVSFAGGKENVADLFVKFVDSLPAKSAGKLEVLPDDDSGKKGGPSFSADALKVLEGIGADPERVKKFLGGDK